MNPFPERKCAWCGDSISDHNLIVAKSKEPTKCKCQDCKYVKRLTCGFRCMMDLKNFKQRMIKNKALSNPKNLAVAVLLDAVPWIMIERKRLKPIAEEITSIIRLSDKKVSPREFPEIKIRKNTGLLKLPMVIEH